MPPTRELRCGRSWSRNRRKLTKLALASCTYTSVVRAGRSLRGGPKVHVLSRDDPERIRGSAGAAVQR